MARKEATRSALPFNNSVDGREQDSKGGQGEEGETAARYEAFYEEELGWGWDERPGWRAILKVERPDNTRRWWSLVP